MIYVWLIIAIFGLYLGLVLVGQGHQIIAKLNPRPRVGDTVVFVSFGQQQICQVIAVDTDGTTYVRPAAPASE